VGKKGKGDFLFLKIFGFLNWADMWGPYTP
jgi:hypothetical protein